MKKITEIRIKHGFEDGSTVNQSRKNQNGLTRRQLMQVGNSVERGRTMVAIGVATHGGEKCRYLQIEVERER